jgi:hypothetical protein
VGGDRHAQIAKRAYELWETDGRPDGCDVAHWLRAEAELNQKLSVRMEARRVPAPVRSKKTKHTPSAPRK